MKTIVMMIGEFDFDNLFSDTEYKPPAVTWVLFFLFVIVMTILLMNLMVSTTRDHIFIIKTRTKEVRASKELLVVVIPCLHEPTHKRAKASIYKVCAVKMKSQLENITFL